MNLHPAMYLSNYKKRKTAYGEIYYIYEEQYATYKIMLMDHGAYMRAKGEVKSIINQDGSEWYIPLSLLKQVIDDIEGKNKKDKEHTYPPRIIRID